MNWSIKASQHPYAKLIIKNGYVFASVHTQFGEEFKFISGPNEIKLGRNDHSKYIWSYYGSNDTYGFGDSLNSLKLFLKTL